MSHTAETSPRTAARPEVGAWGAAAALLHGLVAGLTAVAAVLRVQPDQHFAAPIAGALALQGGRKGGDLVALPLGVAVAVVVGLAVAAAVRAHPDRRRRDAAAAQFVWWACPGAVAVGALFTGAPLEGGLVGLTLAAAGLLCAETVLSRRAGRLLAPQALSASVLGCVAWAAAVVAVLVAASRTTYGVASALDRLPPAALVVATGAIAGLLEVVGAWRGREAMHRRGRLFVAVPASALPLLVLALHPARLRLPDGASDSYDTSAGLLVACLVTAAVGILACVRALRRQRQAPDVGRRILPPAATAALVVATMFGATRPPVVSSDDYHLGEMLLGLVRYRAGELPFVDHQPAHGMVQDDLVALVAAIFFDGSAAGQVEATRITCALLAAVLFAVVLLATRSQLLASVVTLVGASSIVSGAVPLSGMTWIFLMAVGWLLVAPPLRTRPHVWLSVWVLAFPVLVLAAPAQGLVVWLAAAPLAIRSFAQVLTARDRRRLTPPVAAVIVVIALGVLTPLAEMMTAALRYVLANAAVNTPAYGIAWRPGFAGGGGDTTFSFEIFRMMWVVGLVLCTTTALAQLRRRQWFGELFARSVYCALMIGGVLPYVMGRVDIGGTSRAGLATVFVMALVVPTLVWHRLRAPGRAMTAVGMVTSAATIFGSFAVPGNVVASASAFVSSPDLVDGVSVGLPGWGRAAADDPDELDQVVRLGQALDEELGAGQSYYDATSRNAQYFYLDRLPTVAVTAVYNTPLAADQRRTIDELRAARPRVAVLQQPLGNTEHDGGGLALRTPLLTRFLEDSYTPYRRDGFILGIWGRRPPEGVDEALELALDEASDGEWDRGVSRTTVAIRLDDPAAALMLEAGVELLLPDGSTRRVTGTQAGGVVSLDGPTLDSLVGATARAVAVSVADVDRRLYRTWLFEQSFGRTNLEHLPESWGASVGEMEGIAEVSAIEGGGRLDGSAPVVQLDLPGGIQDTDVDLLSFDLVCEGDPDGTGVAQMEVGWESPRTYGDAPRRTFDISRSGRQLVPLDSSAYWRAGFGAESLSIRVLYSDGCDGVSVSDVSLWEREDVTP